MPPGKPEKYLELAGAIRQLIGELGLRRGDALPPERELSRRFCCTQLTVRKALRLLEQERLIHKIPSRGSYLGPKPPEPAGAADFAGFLFPDDEIFYYKLFAALEPFFAASGVHPVVHLTNGDAAKEVKILDFLEEAGARFLIAQPNPACAARYAAFGVPTVFFDSRLEGVAMPAVFSDDYAGAAAAVEHLASLGHRRIGYVGSVGDPAGRLRHAGWEGALRRHGLKVEERYVKLQQPTRDRGFYAARELLELSEPPTAVCCGNDTLAAGVIRCCGHMRLGVPGDLSVVGYGNTPIAEDLGLSSVSQQSPQLAAEIVRLVKVLLAGGERPGEVMLPTYLVLRASTARPKKI